MSVAIPTAETRSRPISDRSLAQEAAALMRKRSTVVRACQSSQGLAPQKTDALLDGSDNRTVHHDGVSRAECEVSKTRRKEG